MNSPDSLFPIPDSRIRCFRFASPSAVVPSSPVSLNRHAVTDGESITQLLLRWRNGERDALDALMPQVYAELRRAADVQLRGERDGAVSLQPTALVHEVYLKLVGGADIDWQDRGHFFAVAARLMRQILVDHARRRDAAKRDGGERVTLTSLDQPSLQEPRELLALDQALHSLEALDARKARVVELRVFGGLDFAEIGVVLGLSRATLDREFRSARVWLYDAVAGGVP
jgi:RNA polymerase sigma factor (TIGR02999 family)